MARRRPPRPRTAQRARPTPPRTRLTKAKIPPSPTLLPPRPRKVEPRLAANVTRFWSHRRGATGSFRQQHPGGDVGAGEQTLGLFGGGLVLEPPEAYPVPGAAAVDRRGDDEGLEPLAAQARR